MESKIKQKETNYIKKHQFTDIDEVLISKFGKNFEKYRKDYYNSLDYINNELPPFPFTVSFELVNRCNLKCIMCYTDHHKKTKTTLDLNSIENILKECDENNLPAAVIGMGAEALLYKDVKKVVSLCKKYNVMDVFFGTNGTLLKPEVSKFLIESKVARLEVSLDAASSDAYKKIRGKDELLKVEENVKNFLKIRKEMNSKLPLLRLCFCVQKENVTEVEEFKNKWTNMGVDYIDFQNMVDFSGVGPTIDEDKEWKAPPIESLKDEEIHCSYPFNSLHVWSDGAITPCCTYYGKALVMGNTKEDKLKDVWNSKKLNNLRKELKDKKTLNSVCRTCLFREKKHFTSV